MSTLTRKRLVLRPMAATTYLLRNGGKTLPLTGAIVLAALLVAGIVAMINSIPYSIRSVYLYAQESMAIGPRGDPQLTPVLADIVKKESPVPIERMMYIRSMPTYVKSIVGKWPFIVIGFEKPDMKYFLARQNVTTVEGRLPNPEEPAAVVSEPVARNLGLKIGSVLLGPNLTDSWSPYPVKVVGIAHTDRWLMFSDIEYVRENHFPPVNVILAFAHGLKDQDALGRWSENRFKGGRAQVFAFHMLDKDTRENFSILYKILDVVIGMLAVVVTFMMGMLMNIYQGQRLVEFGLLQAIGYTKRQLLVRAFREIIYVLAAGWALGLVTAYGLIRIVKVQLMDPHAFSLDPFDPVAYKYTIPIPLAILVVGTLTVIWRFRRFDPVGVVERRLV